MLIDRFAELTRSRSFYRYLQPAEVSPVEWDAVDIARAAARADLGLPEPSVRFYVVCHPTQATWSIEGPVVDGLVRDGVLETIEIRAHRGYWPTLGTSLHECRHLYQRQRGQHRFKAIAEREEDARNYSALVSGWLRELEKTA